MNTREMKDFLRHRPRLAPFLIAVVSAGALAVALVSEHGFGLEPCVLCFYQRYAYAAALAIGLLGAAMGASRFNAALFCLLGALALLAGGAIAGFHVGVEQHWWKGTAGCHLPSIEQGMTVDELRAVLEARDSVTPCDEVPWSLFGISMAGYNFIVSLILAGAALFAASALWRQPR
ncbi:MAG: disulfide bond formation protein B [Rhodovibrionaceae bacterium]|nr:disulfide bond formation protein B [Rhodovibrionaceae bacterium]